jgi:hypothetical protein
MSCSICLSEFDPLGDENTEKKQKELVLDCNHKFHLNCIKPWIEVRLGDVPCPLCQTLIGKEWIKKSFPELGQRPRCGILWDALFSRFLSIPLIFLALAVVVVLELFQQSHSKMELLRNQITEIALAGPPEFQDAYLKELQSTIHTPCSSDSPKLSLIPHALIHHALVIPLSSLTLEPEAKVILRKMVAHKNYCTLQYNALLLYFDFLERQALRKEEQVKMETCQSNPFIMTCS